uniref:ABC transporter domain-containing protein n=1 Tax=Arcella intermedia TaxID=1963864 RepID=A0A6B2L2M0_9EUKA
MIAFAFLLSVFFTKTRTASIIGYIIMILSGIISDNILSSIISDPNTPISVLRGISVIPQFCLFRGLRALRNGVAWGGPGMTWSNLTDYGMHEVFIFLVVEWAVFLLLAFYFEAVLPIGPGVKKHPLFFLPKALRSRSTPLSPDKGEESKDVAEERRIASTEEKFPIRVLDLHKRYPPSAGRGPKIAVNNLSMTIHESECFGFLGPNGAGKSTTINMLCGYLRPTSGTAKIRGLDIVEDVDEIHMQMGVCPQENVLWDDLTGPEHLRFYGRIKNLRGEELEEQVAFWLDQVNLTKAKNKTSSQYSGGMKRRLCVAIAMIGNPSVVLLDEPTTGLDPASRQDLWKVITEYKKSCSMLLTTHSMEEAEELCDRLGIFVGGKLAAVGTPQYLKAEFGQGYRLGITTPQEYEEETKKFVFEIAPKAIQLNSLAGTQNFEIPKNSIKLSKIFKVIEKEKEKRHITDWGLSNTTLEEVFLHIIETTMDTQSS